MLAQLYRSARLFVNFFQPSFKLIRKERDVPANFKSSLTGGCAARESLRRWIDVYRHWTYSMPKHRIKTSGRRPFWSTAPEPMLFGRVEIADAICRRARSALVDPRERLAEFRSQLAHGLIGDRQCRAPPAFSSTIRKLKETGNTSKRHSRSLPVGTMTARKNPGRLACRPLGHSNSLT